MEQFNPPSPGEVLDELYLKPRNLSIRKVASHLEVSPSTLSRLINGKIEVSPEMALRLQQVFGHSAEAWLTMQSNYNLWQLKTTQPMDHLKPLDFS